MGVDLGLWWPTPLHQHHTHSCVRSLRRCPWLTFKKARTPIPDKRGRQKSQVPERTPLTWTGVGKNRLKSGVKGWAASHLNDVHRWLPVVVAVAVDVIVLGKLTAQQPPCGVLWGATL